MSLLGNTFAVYTLSLCVKTVPEATSLDISPVLSSSNPIEDLVAAYTNAGFTNSAAIGAESSSLLFSSQVFPEVVV